MACKESLSFDIDNDDYRTFIRNLREELSRSTSVVPSSMWLECCLIVGDRSITMRIDRKNLTMCEFKTDSNSQFRMYSYSSMIHRPDSPQYSGCDAKDAEWSFFTSIERDGLLLGYAPLRDAISYTADAVTPSSNLKLCRMRFLTITQMIADAARIELLADHIAQNWMEPFRITFQMVWLEEEEEAVPCMLEVDVWGTFQSTVPSWDCTPPPMTTPLFSKRVVRRVLLYRRLAWFYRLPDRALPQGRRCLMSIEYVRLKSIAGKNRGKLYGIVTMDEGDGPQVVYNRSRNNPESTRAGECISLTGPPTEISGHDWCCFDLRLWDRDDDDEIAAGGFEWNDIKIPHPPYNVPLEEDVSGKHGCVTVGYSVIYNALTATINVVMSYGDRKTPVDVYGTIEASTLLKGSSLKWMLFDKRADEHVRVHPQEAIPLTRSFVTASVEGCFTVAANLWDPDSKDQIVLGSLQFNPMVGTTLGSLQFNDDKYGEVQVSITFV